MQIKTGKLAGGNASHESGEQIAANVLREQLLPGGIKIPTKRLL